MKSIPKLILSFFITLVLSVSVLFAMATETTPSVDWEEYENAVAYLSEFGIIQDSPTHSVNTISAVRAVNDDSGAVTVQTLPSPNNSVSAYDFACLAMRTFDGPDVDVDGYLNEMYQQCMTTSIDLLKEESVTAETVYLITLPKSGVYPYPVECYEDADEYASDIRQAAKLTGLDEIVGDHWNERMNYGQTVVLLYRLMTEQYEPIEELTTEEPCPFLDQFEETTQENYLARNSIVYSWDKIPEEYREKFVHSGWKVVHEQEHTYGDALYQVPGGTFFADDKVIALNNCDAGTLIHEFGHYVSLGCNHLDLALEKLYDMESESAHDILGYYAMKNADEYFAEAFEYFIMHQDDEEDMLAFRLAAPKTVELCEMIVNDEDGRVSNRAAMDLVNGNAVTVISVREPVQIGWVQS